MRKAFSVFAVAAVCASLLVTPAHAQPNPYQIFANARQYWMQQRYPQKLQYQVAVDIVEGGKERVEHYDASYDAVENIVDVDPTSDYERDHPVKPSGVNVGFFGVNLTKPLVSADFLGVPKLRPNYSFGMAPFVPAPSPTPFNSMALVEEIRKEFHDPNPHKKPSPSPAPSLPEIATVYAQNREYTITLLGTDTINGHGCYHLALKPVHDPGRYRIREAWIDESTFAPWQLKNSINFASGPGTAVPWTIHFADIDGAHYISDEKSDAPIAADGEIYTQAEIRFEGVVASTKPPRIELPGGSRVMLEEP